MAGEKLLRNAKRIPLSLSLESAGLTSGHAFICIWPSTKAFRFSFVISRSSDLPSKTSASSITPRKSRYLWAAVRSHVYSNCRVRHTLDNSAPRPGKSSSAIAKMGRGSKIGKPSKAIALIAGFASAAAAAGVNIVEAVTALEAIFKNLRRVIDLELSRARTRVSAPQPPDTQGGK